jgi:hypothetical protein
MDQELQSSKARILECMFESRPVHHYFLCYHIKPIYSDEIKLKDLPLERRRLRDVS